MYNSAATSRLVNPFGHQGHHVAFPFGEIERRPGPLASGGDTGAGQIGFDAAQERLGADRRQQVVGGVQFVQGGTPPSLGQQDPPQGVVQAGPIEEGVVGAE